ncbi:nitroreductase family protein [Mycolicibacterium hodleri]|uniref:Nitroreductase family protein n=1 Tax=Mycolicibacterium hodleri TaxID=49897 RepID=A0A502EJF9_9MYCO|nr:nitroreductase family protein [Mycolicibacterium hodleri]TPG36461.1 nitroreductase family protein [Mycolicibacterium hodleri]
MGDLFGVIGAQRACRRFDPDGEVSDEDLGRMLEAAVHAPSAENTQPWAFVVVRDAEARAELAAWWTEMWNAGGKDLVRQTLEKSLVDDLEHGFARGGLAAATVVVVVCADTEKVHDVYLAASIYPAVQNLLLAAGDLGYGSLLTTGLTLFGVDGVRQRLALPDTMTPMAAVYIGRPARALAKPRRNPAASVTYREQFGTPWRT